MKLFELSSAADDATARTEALESGDILYLASSPLMPTPEEREVMTGLAQLSGAFHKNIAYKPSEDKLSGLAGADRTLASKVCDILRGYSRRTVEFVGKMLPSYRSMWKLDYASFRPVEEHGRSLPLKKRNDLLHVDAFPTRPTRGALILRVFTNINPEKDRVWIVSDPFEHVAAEWAASAGLGQTARRARSSMNSAARAACRFLHSTGLPVVDRSPYDEFMLGFHDYLKKNDEYQSGCAKYRFAFPPGSTWMVFTDVVPHAVESGQHAMEQTFIVARESLLSRDRAPASILERLAGTTLAS